MNARHRLGARAEATVARWLEDRGWRILATRHRAPNGEIDLLALDPTGVLVAVEVRARRSRRAGVAAESIDARRVARLERALAAFAATGRIRHRGLRVDLVTLDRLSDRGAERWRLRRIPGVVGR